MVNLLSKIWKNIRLISYEEQTIVYFKLLHLMCNKHNVNVKIIEITRFAFSRQILKLGLTIRRFQTLRFLGCFKMSLFLFLCTTCTLVPIFFLLCMTCTLVPTRAKFKGTSPTVKVTFMQFNMNTIWVRDRRCIIQDIGLNFSSTFLSQGQY